MLRGYRPPRPRVWGEVEKTKAAAVRHCWFAKDPIYKVSLLEHLRGVSVCCNPAGKCCPVTHEGVCGRSSCPGCVTTLVRPVLVENALTPHCDFWEPGKGASVATLAEVYSRAHHALASLNQKHCNHPANQQSSQYFHMFSWLVLGFLGLVVGWFWGFSVLLMKCAWPPRVTAWKRGRCLNPRGHQPHHHSVVCGCITS